MQDGFRIYPVIEFAVFIYFNEHVIFRMSFYLIFSEKPDVEINLLSCCVQKDGTGFVVNNFERFHNGSFLPVYKARRQAVMLGGELNPHGPAHGPAFSVGERGDG